MDVQWRRDWGVIDANCCWEEWPATALLPLWWDQDYLHPSSRLKRHLGVDEIMNSLLMKYFIKYLCKIWSWLRIFYLVWIFSSSVLEKKPSLNWPPSDQQDPVCHLLLRLDSLWQWCGKTLILTCICLNSDLRSDSLQLQLLCPSCPPSPLFIDLFQTNRLFCSWPQWIKHLMTWVRVGYKIW